MGPDRQLFTQPGLDSRLVANAIIQFTGDHFLVVAADTTIAGCNQMLADAVGAPAEEIIGRSVFDFIDAADLDRAAHLLPHATAEGAPGGTAPFRVTTAAGEVLTAEVSADSLEIDGEHFVLFRGRPVYWPQAADALLDHLLSGSPLIEPMRLILECFAWREDGSSVAVAWREDGELRSVDTGLDARLCGTDPRAEPWARLRVSSGSASGLVDELPDPTSAIAADAGFSTYWIDTIDSVGPAGPVLVSAFGTRNGFPVSVLHLSAMELAHRYIRLVLGWTDQVARLEVAARHDPLTGLANRRKLEESLGRESRPGAVMCCDLDDFKPVNDTWGHAIGDDVLVEVGRRLTTLVRADDLVARVGGDEFTVVAWGAGADEAQRLAQRIRHTLAEPISVSVGAVTVGVSVGWAVSDRPLDAATISQADAALYADKRAER